MFGYQKTKVYQKVKPFVVEIRKMSKEIETDWATKNQLIRSSMSILLNIAEGNGRYSSADQRHFLVMSRSSLFETIAILEMMLDCDEIDQSTYDEFYSRGEELSEMIYSMIKYHSK